ncbi:uncharacterized protein CEXT_102811 [Caerostris extrusa]|uniref:Gustatory receptor n=1 Tax=Caerostris extrusa TaxID=172846 RepID=A0AAV4QBA9_CAEEX|nr:uncharacterized protein CEXT_102811 [Caerostris extrusa]
MVLKFCYPLLLHGMLFYCWTLTVMDGKLNYATIIDTILPFLPCVMWVMIYRIRTSLKTLLVYMANTITTGSTRQSRYLPIATNIALLMTFAYPPFLLAMKLIQGNSIRLVEICRNIQEILFPSILTVLYSSICYSLYCNLVLCKKLFLTKLDMSCSLTVKTLHENYINVLKSVELFEDLLSNPVFFLVFQNFCTVSIIVMDMMNVKDWMSTLMLEALAYFVYILAGLGILTILADKITLEVQSIKMVLLDKISEQSDRDILFINEKLITLTLKRDACVFTGKVFRLREVF